MRERLVAFLDQFPEELIPPMMEVLERFVFLDRSVLGLRFPKFLEDTAIGSVPTGLTTDPGKSSNLLSYYLQDAGCPLPQQGLHRALESGRVLLFDDFLMSGKQARTAIQRLLGLAPDLPNEHLADRLEPALEARFREAHLSFRFAAAHSNGLAALRELIEALGLNADVQAMELVDNSSVFALADGRIKNELVQFLRTVGFALLRSTKQTADPGKWTDELCESRAVGYDGLGLVLASFYNVPTSTITAVWCRGTFRNTEWLPLLPRRS